MRPEIAFRIGSVQASVFKNQYAAEDGAVRTSYSVNLHRRYRDRQSKEWKSTAVFRLPELPQVEAVVRLALAYVAEREAAGGAPEEELVGAED